MEFKPFDKIARMFRTITVSEKLDGTNACIHIVKPEVDVSNFDLWTAQVGEYLIWAGSRTRWITPDNDNFGFAQWVKDHAEELVHLGPGTHRGEWWGLGIQRGYGLDHRRFSLFNTSKWCDFDAEPEEFPTKDPRVVNKQMWAPPCCHVVPVLYRGLFDSEEIKKTLDWLQELGSSAAIGFKKPEGVVIYHEAANVYFKATIEKDDGKHG